MKRFAAALALVASVTLALAPAVAWAAPPYPQNSVGTTQNGMLDALTDIYNNTLNGGGVAQASNTSGQLGPLVQCAASTSAPSLTTAKTYPCSLTLAGAMRIDGSGTTQPVSLTSLPGFAAIPAFKTDLTTPGTTNLVSAAQSGTWNINNISGTITLPTGASTATGQASELARLPATLSTVGNFKVAPDGVDDATSVGGTISSAAVLSNGPFTTVGFGGGHIDWQITSTGSGNTVVLESSSDGTTWYSVAVVATQATGGTPATTITNSTALSYQSPVIGTQMRWRVSSYSSGTVTVAGYLRRSPVNMIGFVQNVASSAGTSSLFIQGADAQGSAAAGRPVAIGCQGRTSTLTAVTNGQITASPCTPNGALIVRMNALSGDEWTANLSLSDGSSTALHASCGAGLKNYVTWLNYSTVTTTTAVTLSALDGVSSKFDEDVAASAGGRSYNFSTPLQGSAATAFNVQLSGSPTGAVKVRAGGYCAP